MGLWGCALVNVAVIGVSGFLGSAIFESLSGIDGFNVAAAGDHFRKLQSADTFLYDFLAIDVIVNCAGPSSEHCEQFPRDAYDCYHNYQVRLLDYCEQFAKRLISFSTIHVYDLSLGVISETTERVSAHPYVKYRQVFEDRISLHQAGGHVLLRLGNCFGQSKSKSQQKNKLIINSMVNAFHLGRKFEVASEVDFHRPYVPITYLSNIIKKIILKGVLENSIVNVVPKSSTPISRIIDYVESISEHNFVEHNFKSVGRKLIFDNSKCDGILEFSEDSIYHELREMMVCGQ